jgi:glycosyltransferase involved in cell wall biosynthesis
MSSQLKVLAPTRYGWAFNGPRVSTHRIVNRVFLPLNKISSDYEGVTFLAPGLFDRFDLVHAFNRIPIGPTPYIIGYESHLPRGYGVENTTYYRHMVRSLLSRRCRSIVAISDHAMKCFAATHQAATYWPELRAKLKMRLPNTFVPDVEDNILANTVDEIRLTFVGAHFARKGGCVAARIAELARERGLPVVVNIVSKLEYGGAIWTDPPDRAFYRPYIEALSAANVNYYSVLPNSQVLQLLRRSHFSILTTFGDTFGYSAIESMINYTPVIATAQCALTEFIKDGENGILLDLPVNELGEWLHLSSPDRHTHWFAANFRDEVERLAEAALDRVLAVLEDVDAYHRMRAAARDAAVRRFNHVDAAAYWDSEYLSALEKD